ncbi:MAG: protein translocase subunit SecD [Chloroflexota bacterium]
MQRRNTLFFLILIVVFLFALAVVVPIDKGTIFERGIKLGLDLQGGLHLVYQADLSQIAEADRSEAVEGVVAVLANRINPLGVTEPVIQKQGEDSILVELPGKSISDREKEGLSQVDILEFGELILEGEAKWENELGKWKPATAVIDGEEKTLSSRYFKENTFVTRGNSGEILLVFEWNEEGSKISTEVTGRLVGKQLGIFEGSHTLYSAGGQPIAPVVNSVITDQGQVEGLTLDDAVLLSRQLNYGRLPVALTLVYDDTITPVLGSDFVSKGVRAGLIGVALVMLFMVLYYRLAGLVSCLALTFYGVLVLALFKLWAVTLTLSGIGGFIVSLGMAVDANVLIFERMKEELNAGQTLGAAIEAGFSRAWRAIWDSNFTTFIVCGVLYWLGSSIAESAPLMGFALTLFIGVAVSMFSAVLVSHTMLRLFVGTAASKRLWLFTSIYSGKV